MGFIIKPLVTEKMTMITEKSSRERSFRALNEKAAKAKNAKEEKFSYVVKHKGQADVNKEKTVYTYIKPACQQFGFLVKPEANKIEIKNEIEEMFNVTVIAVNTMKYAGKRSSRYTRSGFVKGKRNAFKKAIVTLKEGDTIDFYSNIE
jgi:large subunit ribosomal protein L23